MGLLQVFLSTLLLSFGLSLLISGIFGAKFGEGKSRSVGIIISLFGLLMIGLFASLTWELVPGIEPAFHARTVAQSSIAVASATLGTFLAVGLFIASVMKS